jgi:hypothetical protein
MSIAGKNGGINSGKQHNIECAQSSSGKPCTPAPALPVLLLPRLLLRLLVAIYKPVSQFTMNGQHINDSTPTIKWNLATMGEVDANSVEMRVSGVGLVPANYAPKSKVVTYAFTQKLWPKTYTVWKHAGTSQLIGNKITIYNILHRHPNASRYSLSHYCGSVCNLMSPDLLCSISERLFLPYF